MWWDANAGVSVKNNLLVLAASRDAALPTSTACFQGIADIVKGTARGTVLVFPFPDAPFFFFYLSQASEDVRLSFAYIPF